ncbi:MAG: hypothetical protein U0575_08985 [Phycisphaerales bacterium]
MALLAQAGALDLIGSRIAAPFSIGVPTQEIAWTWACRLAAIGVAVSSAEYLVNRDVLRDGGLMSWDVGRVRSRWQAGGPLGTTLGAVVAYPNVLVTMALRLVLAVALAVGAERLAFSAWLTLPTALLLIVMPLRTRYGHDGADQMGAVVLVSLSIGNLVATPLARDLALGFIAVQAVLAYTIAGLAKLKGRGWRNGTALIKVAGTDIYGHPTVGRWLRAWPRAALVSSWFIMAWETCFPCIFVIPRPWSLAYLATGVMFHLSNAIVMGLNTFLWSFMAAYPALLYWIDRMPTTW